MRALVIILSLCAGAAEAAEPGDPYEARRAQCVAWMMTAYPSGLEEGACTSEFGLPSPFLFACARAEYRGFESTSQREACRVFFARAAETAAEGYVLR